MHVCGIAVFEEVAVMNNIFWSPGFSRDVHGSIYSPITGRPCACARSAESMARFIRSSHMLLQS